MIYSDSDSDSDVHVLCSGRSCLLLSLSDLASLPVWTFVFVFHLTLFNKTCDFVELFYLPASDLITHIPSLTTSGAV